MRDRLVTLTDLMREFRYITIIGFLGLAIFSYGFFDLSIPSLSFIFEGSIRFFFLGFVITAVILFYPVKDIVNGLIQEDKLIIFRINNEKQRLIRRFEFPKNALKEFSFKKKPYSYDVAEGRVLVVSDIDRKKKILTGIDIGSYNEVELAMHREVLNKLRVERSKLIKEALEIKRRLPEIIMSIEANYYENETKSVLKSLDTDKEIFKDLNILETENYDDDEDSKTIIDELGIDSVNLSVDKEERSNE